MDYNCPDVNSKFPGEAQSPYTTTSIPERRIQKADIRVHWLLCINTTDLRYKKTPNKTLRGAMQFTAACMTGHGKGLPSAFESSVALAAVINLLVSITFQQKKKPWCTGWVFNLQMRNRKARSRSQILQYVVQTKSHGPNWTDCPVAVTQELNGNGFQEPPSWPLTVVTELLRDTPPTNLGTHTSKWYHSKPLQSPAVAKLYSSRPSLTLS